MNTVTRVGAFGAGLAVAFGAALGAGRMVGPFESAAAPAPHAAEHGADGHETTGTAVAPAGLSATDQGYRLVAGASTVAPSPRARLTFQVLGPDGHPVTGFTTAHEKKLHLIVVRRDLSGFQHVHPTMAVDGTWSVDVDLSRPGQWRMFADFDPDGDTEGLVLGSDIAVPGDYSPVALPASSDASVVDGYTVRREGALDPARPRPVDFTVTRGQTVVPLEPYLGADGHLVVLREGDLAYAHAHPVHSTAMGRESLGRVGFQVEAPGPGRYRMFLDFKTEGTVRTAAFTEEAGTTP